MLFDSLRDALAGKGSITEATIDLPNTESQ